MSKSTKKHFDLIDMICDRLRYKNKPMWYEIVKKSLKQLPKDNYWYTSLSEIFWLEMKKVDPFENFDIDKISTEDLPF